MMISTLSTPTIPADCIGNVAQRLAQLEAATGAMQQAAQLAQLQGWGTPQTVAEQYRALVAYGDWLANDFMPLDPDPALLQAVQATCAEVTRLLGERKEERGDR